MSLVGTPGLVRGLLPEDPFAETYLVRPGGRDGLRAGAGRADHDRRPRRRSGGRAHCAGRRTVATTPQRSERARMRRQRSCELRSPNATEPPRPRARCARARPCGRERRPALRRVVASRVGADLPRRARGHGRRRRTGRSHRRRRAAALGAPRRGAARRRRAPTSSRSSLRRSPSRGSTSESTRRRRSPTRCARASTSRSSTSRASSAPTSSRSIDDKLERGHRARARRDDDPLADGPGLPAARPAREVLRRRHGSARRGRPGHRRPPRHLRPRLHREVLRGHGLPRPRQLHRQLQRRGDAVRDRAAQGLGGAQLLLQHRLRRARTSSSWTSRGRARATTCSCAR